MSEDVAARYTQLQKSLSRSSGVAHRLRCWSRFIRARDNYRCVLCESRNGLAAYHVVRRSNDVVFVRFVPPDPRDFC